MTDEHPIEAYSNVVKEYEQACDRIREIADLYSEMGRFLHNSPYEITITGISPKLPTEISKSGKFLGVDKPNYPTAEQIADAILKLHQTSKRVDDTWENLDTKHRGLVQRQETKRPKWL